MTIEIDRNLNDRIINVKNTLTMDDYFKNKIIIDNIKNFYFPKNFLYLSKLIRLAFPFFSSFFVFFPAIFDVPL